MHGVERSAEPEFFCAIRCRYDTWDELYDVAGAQVRNCRQACPPPCCTAYLQGRDGEGIRQEIRNALGADFSGICGYCEQDGAGMVTVIEHFRPRSLFPSEWLTWTNLVYACQRCDDHKGDKWPDEPGNQDPSYSYVNPNLSSAEPPAEEFFEYYLGFDDMGPAASMTDLVPGQIVPSPNLSARDWWRAERTIVDLDLNSDSSYVASADERLPHLRNVYLDELINYIETSSGDLYSNINTARAELERYAQPDQPFSSYVSAFVKFLTR